MGVANTATEESRVIIRVDILYTRPGESQQMDRNGDAGAVEQQRTPERSAASDGSEAGPNDGDEAGIEAFREVAARLAGGDVGARFPESNAELEADGAESIDDEAAALASDLNDFLDGITETLSAAEGFGDEVAGASEHVRSNVDRAKEYSDEVYAGVDGIESAATAQRDDITEATREL